MNDTTLKRVIDVAGAGLLLAIASPILLAVAFAIRWKSGKPLLFRQTRIGRNGRPFMLLKFRTMRSGPGAEPDAVRLTPLGEWLRKTSLDELPQLWNVLRGDMSLVGPRPLLPQYLSRYSKEQARRHEVLPGITGLAQVSGRNGLTWEEKFERDVWYVDHRSTALDLSILWRTALALMRSEGISARDHATMPEFTGSPSRAPTAGHAGHGGPTCATS
jgi:lipopolysaccharide/colanic/teichoic acid biosynthesis glycosyltransferase